MSAAPLSPEQLHVVEWAAAECERQRSGERSVSWMLTAWQYAMRESGLGPPTEDDVLALGRLVEPEKNANGYRKVGVRVGWSVKGPWQQVPRQVAALVEAVDRLDADKWYYEYEEVHPFLDGNGRTGTILWNWLRGTLAEPVDPPNLWPIEDALDAEELRRTVSARLLGSA